MSNPRAWRAKPRTSKPNSRQKRNGLYLDAHPICADCNDKPAVEAHHELPMGHPDRFEWANMKALCVGCHVLEHQHANKSLDSSTAM